MIALTIQERIKGLRIEREPTLKEPAGQTGLSSSTPGSYETDETKGISRYALIKPAKLHGVTDDCLPGLTETKHHPDAELADLRLSDDMIDVLKGGRAETVWAKYLNEYRRGELDIDRGRKTVFTAL